MDLRIVFLGIFADSKRHFDLLNFRRVGVEKRKRNGHRVFGPLVSYRILVRAKNRGESTNLTCCTPLKIKCSESPNFFAAEAVPHNKVMQSIVKAVQW